MSPLRRRAQRTFRWERRDRSRSGIGRGHRTGRYPNTYARTTTVPSRASDARGCPGRRLPTSRASRWTPGRGHSLSRGAARSRKEANAGYAFRGRDRLGRWSEPAARRPVPRPGARRRPRRVLAEPLCASCRLASPARPSGSGRPRGLSRSSRAARRGAARGKQPERRARACRGHRRSSLARGPTGGSRPWKR